MKNLLEIQHRLKHLGFDSSVLEKYSEPHRYFHNLNHLLDLLNSLQIANRLDDDELFLASVYHDCIYWPDSETNEEDSAAYFEQAASKSNLSKESINNVVQIIIDTKMHQGNNEKSAYFQSIDQSILKGSFEELLTYEEAIFKEFQYLDYTVYKLKRLEFLSRYEDLPNVQSLIAYLHRFKPNIAVFPGSFNPFHKGHYNVLIKAEQIFDKVIIAFGKNPDKTQRNWPLPKTIKYRQQMEYDGLLTDFVDSLPYPVTVVRGLRNSTDFNYEQNQYRYIQELKPDIRIINIFCDKEFEHISSSGIRTLEKFNKHANYLLD